MTIVISDNTILFFILIIGFVVGFISCWLLMKNTAELDDYRSLDLTRLRLDAAIAEYEIKHNINKPPRSMRPTPPGAE